MREYLPIYKTNQVNRFKGYIKKRDVGTEKIKCACETCNNTWMSDIQNSCKPVLGPKITSPLWKSISESEAKSIAVWVFMTMMVFDRDQNSRAVFSSEERNLFSKTREVPDNITIYIGSLCGVAGRGIHHNPLLDIGYDKEYEPVIGCIFGVLFGTIFILLTYKRDIMVDFDSYIINRSGMIQVFPNIEKNGVIPFTGLRKEPRVLLDEVYRRSFLTVVNNHSASTA
jgi:hypothetical protein